MSGDWIKVEVTLPDKPEVWQIAGMLNLDADAVVGKLIRVWAWFDQHTLDGNAASVTYALLDRIASVTGFAEAMALAGWLDQDGSILRLPRFERHNGKTAKNRALTNARVAKKRTSNAESNADVTPDVTLEALQKPLPEKRREEKKEKKGSSSGLDLSNWPALPDDQLLRDWMEVRRKKKGSNTRTALQAIGRELRKAVDLGFTVDQCVETAVVKNWCGFEAEWMSNAARSAANGSAEPQRRLQEWT